MTKQEPKDRTLPQDMRRIETINHKIKMLEIEKEAILDRVQKAIEEMKQ